MSGDERRQMDGLTNGIRGWLLVVCLLLLIWQPISFGLVASSLLGRLAMRGTPLALVLIARVLVTAFGIAAGLALVRRRHGAVKMAVASFAMTAATDVFVYTTPFLPNNRAPGETFWYVGASLTYSAVWIAYLLASRRVRQTFR